MPVPTLPTSVYEEMKRKLSEANENEKENSEVGEIGEHLNFTYTNMGYILVPTGKGQQS